MDPAYMQLVTVNCVKTTMLCVIGATCERAFFSQKLQISSNSLSHQKSKKYLVIDTPHLKIVLKANWVDKSTHYGFCLIVT